MLKLSPVEKEVLSAVYELFRDAPHEYFLTKQIFVTRMRERGGLPSTMLLRTTDKFLHRLAKKVPALVEKGTEGWKLLPTGEAVFTTQIKTAVDKGGPDDFLEDCDRVV